MHADGPDAGPEVRVVFASETGVAEDLAYEARDVLAGAGWQVEVLPMDELELESLEKGGCVIFLSSTTGLGDPPDQAWAFFDESMQEPAELPDLHYALLGLGDRSYPDFCQFPRNLEAWLQASGAQRLFEFITVDDEDEASLAQWKRKLAALATSRRVAATEQ